MFIPNYIAEANGTLDIISNGFIIIQTLVVLFKYIWNNNVSDSSSLHIYWVFHDIDLVVRGIIKNKVKNVSLNRFQQLKQKHAREMLD